MSLTQEKITALVDNYLEMLGKNDPDAMAALYAEGGTIEDPIGSELKIGDAIREFYAKPRVFNFIERIGVVSVSGLYAGFAFHIELQIEDKPVHVYIHEIMTFDESGKIVSMVAVPNFALRDEVAATYPSSKLNA